MANERNLKTFSLPARRLVVFFLTLGGLALPLSASAQEGELSIYGALMPFVDNYRTTGATPKTDPPLSPDRGGASQVSDQDYTGDNLPNRFRMTSGTSHIGFRGKIRLTEHMNAFFQVENMVNVDGESPVLISPWANRNSAVGLTGDYGTLFFGIWDTPYKFPTLFVGALRGLNPFDNTLTGNPGFGVPGTTSQSGLANSKADAAFNRRQGNSIQYWTPTWLGLSARIALSLNESRTMATDVAPSINPILWSALVSYDRGPLSLHYAYEQHLNYFGLHLLGGMNTYSATNTNRHSNDDAHEFVGWYTFSTGTRVAAILELLTYRTEETTTGAPNRFQRPAIYGAVQQRLGLIGLPGSTLWGSFGVAGAGSCTLVGGGDCTTNGLNGRQWSIGYTYSPAKTFDIYASYYETDNGRSASYTFFPLVTEVAPGATTRAFGVGMLYMFDVTMGFGGPKQPAQTPAAPETPTAPSEQPVPEPPASTPPAETPAPTPPAPAPA